MPASPVRVLLRLRPTAIPYPGVRTDDNTISVDLPKKDIAGPNNSIVNHKFTLDGIQESATQEDIYSQVAYGHVQDVLQGYSATVIAYGATGSGKSFSMVGQKASFGQRGIIPRALASIFDAAATSIDRWINVSVSCMEIYNDQMYDLLSDDPATAAELKCQEDQSGKITVQGLTVKATSTEEDALKLFFTAEAARATARGKSGSQASRSHLVFGVHLRIRSCRAAGDAAECADVATLALVDLAGTERAKKAGADGQWMREARSINRSLAFLEQTVSILARGDGKAHIPYRQNRLTAVLKAALSGNSRSTMLVHVWPEATQLEEAVTTLRFAECMRRLQTAPQKEVAAEPEVLLRRCQQQVRDLKQELAMRDTLEGREASSYDELEEAEVQEINGLMRQVLAGELDVDSVPTKTFREIQEAFKQSQVLYQELAAAKAEMQELADAAPAALNAKQAPAKTPPDAKKAAASKGGTPPAAPDAPQESIDASAGESGGSGTWGDGEQGNPGEHGPAGTDDGLTGKRTLPKPQAFTFFKHSVAAGRDAAAALKNVGAQQRAKLQEQAEAAVMIDEEDPELKAAREKLRAIKDGARASHEAYARHGAEAEEMLDTVAEARQHLMDAFEAWFQDEGAFLGEDLQPFDPDETYAIMSRQRIMAEDSEKFPFVAAKRASRGAAGRLKEFAGRKAKGMSMRKKELVAAINFGTVNRH